MLTLENQHSPRIGSLFDCQGLFWQDYFIFHCPVLALFLLSTKMETVLLSSSIPILLSNPIEKSAVVPALELFIFLVLILFLFWTVFAKDHLRNKKVPYLKCIHNYNSVLYAVLHNFWLTNFSLILLSNWCQLRFSSENQLKKVMKT